MRGADTAKALGTPLYVSPEQARGESIDKRSDLYSLGIILYEVMTGLPPFLGGSHPEILMKHHQEIPEPPERINPNISPNLSAIILKSIAKDPDARFSSATAMTRALAEALNVPVPPELGMAPTLPALTRRLLDNAAGVVQSFFNRKEEEKTPQPVLEQEPTLNATISVTDASPTLQRFGNYDLLRLINSGMTGQVWLACQRNTSRREVAVKIIHPHLKDDPLTRTCFRREAEISDYLKNEHVVRDHPDCCVKSRLARGIYWRG